MSGYMLDTRVSLPINTVARPSGLVRRSTRPAAWPNNMTKSGVIGKVPTVARTPSVPK